MIFYTKYNNQIRMYTISQPTNCQVV